MGRIIIYWHSDYKIRTNNVYKRKFGNWKYWVCSPENNYSKEKDLAEFTNFNEAMNYIVKKRKKHAIPA